MDFIRKFRAWTVNTILVLICLCLLMIFITICDKYTQNHHKTTMTFNDMEASRYRMLTEQYKSENARLSLEFSEAQLQAFLKKYGGEKND